MPDRFQKSLLYECVAKCKRGRTKLPGGSQNHLVGSQSCHIHQSLVQQVFLMNLKPMTRRRIVSAQAISYNKHRNLISYYMTVPTNCFCGRSAGLVLAASTSAFQAERTGSNPVSCSRAVLISSNLLPYQNGQLPCRIALYDNGAQARMGTRSDWTASPVSDLNLKEAQLQCVEAGLARKEMRTTNAPSKQNEVMSQPQPTGQQESVSVKCGRSE